MHNLIEFIKKHFHWLVFLILESVSMVMLFRFNDYQASVWLTSANDLAARVNQKYSDIMAYINLGDVNKDLTMRNVMLQRQVSELRDALAYMGADSAIIDEKQRNALEGYDIIPATVTSNTITKANNYIVIDKGKADGVRSEMGVVGGGGIVGIVYLTGKHYSLVIPILNSKSSISCRIRGHNFFGYLSWNGGHPLVAYLNDVPRYARFKVGDYVETSGYSSVFPPGLFVGKILSIEDSRDGMSFSVKVNLATEFAKLRDVCVVSNRDKAEIDTLRIHAAEAEENTN